MGRDGKRRPGVQTDGAQGLGGRFAAIGDAGQRRPGDRSLGADQGGVEPHLGAHGGHGQGRRVGPDDDQLAGRIEPTEQGRARLAAHAASLRQRQGRLQGRGQVGGALTRREAGAVRPVRQPQGRAARAPQLQQGVGGGVFRADPLQQHLDATAAGQAHVRRPALAIDQPARRARGQHLGGVQGDVGLHAAAGEVAGGRVLADQHLGSHAPGRSAVGGGQGGDHGGQAGLDKGVQRRADVVGEPEVRPVHVGEVHRSRPVIGPVPRPPSARPGRWAACARACRWPRRWRCTGPGSPAAGPARPGRWADRRSS